MPDAEEAGDADDEDNAVDVIAYGRAESVLIERYGDQGYDFRPSWWVRLINDNRIILVFALLSGILAFRSSYAEGSETPVDSWRELRKAWKQQRDRAQ